MMGDSRSLIKDGRRGSVFTQTGSQAHSVNFNGFRSRFHWSGFKQENIKIAVTEDRCICVCEALQDGLFFFSKGSQFIRTT